MGRVTLILLAGVTGISFAAIFVRFALPAPPVVTGFYRMLFASLLMAAWIGLRRRRLRVERRAGLLVVASGVCFGTDIAMWQTAVVKTSVALATLLVNTTPVYVGLYTLLVLRQRLDARFGIGAALALGGTGLLLGIPTSGPGAMEGAALALAAGIFYAGYILLVSAARSGIETFPALFLMSLTSTAVLGLYGLLGGDDFHGFPARSWAAMLGAALLSQLCGVMGIVWALRFVPPTVASVALLAQPVGTALLGWLLLDEAIGGPQAAGGAVVLLGIALAARSQGPQDTGRGGR